jgi:O-antigen ligase
MTAVTDDTGRIIDLALARRQRGEPGSRDAPRRPQAMPLAEALVDVRRGEVASTSLALNRPASGIAPSAARMRVPAALRHLAPGRRSAAHLISLAFVWLAVFAGAFVATEPAPVDVLTMGLVVLLPAVGLTLIGRPQIAYLALWLVVIAAGIVSAGEAEVDPTAAFVHMAVSIYLCLGSFVFAAFVARRPEAHSRLIFNAYVWAGLVAAVLGIAGYLGLVSNGLFTVHQRASGLFKVPNVYAPFLIAPMLYLLHEALNSRFVRALAAFVGFAIMALALLMSFSRGAWTALAIAIAVYAWLTFVTARTDRQRMKLVLAGAAGAAMLALVIGAALQIDTVASLFDQRATLDQSYDIGPEGRFGGQMKAIDHIIANPLGIGALQFGGILHAEQPHNVYLAMLLYTGWVGGSVYLMLVLATIAWGLRAVLRRKWPSRTLLITYAAFVGIALEGLVIDTDHWRHFYLLMSILWGQMFFVEGPRRAARIATPQPFATADGPVTAPTAPDLDQLLARRIALAEPTRSARIAGEAPAVPRAIILPRSQRRRRGGPTRNARISP